MRAKYIVKPICYFALASLFLSIGCRKDPKKFVITEKNKETYLEDIKDMRGLTVGEVRLLIGYEFIRNGKKLNGDNPDLIVGKTVVQVLEIAKQEVDFFNKKQKQQEEQRAKQKKEEEEEKNKKIERLQAMDLAVSVTVESKEFETDVRTQHGTSDYIVLTISAENHLNKDIRALEGDIVFRDLFNKDMYTVNITYMEGLKSKEKKTGQRAIQYNSYKDGLVWLKTTKPKDIKWYWVPKSILCTDGQLYSAADK